MDEQLTRDMLSGIIGDYLLLQSKVEAQGTLLLTVAAALFEPKNPLQVEVARKIDNNLKKSIHSIYEKKLASHAYLDNAWKQKLQIELGDIPGILIEAPSK